MEEYEIGQSVIFEFKFEHDNNGKIYKIIEKNHKSSGWIYLLEDWIWCPDRYLKPLDFKALFNNLEGL